MSGVPPTAPPAPPANMYWVLHGPGPDTGEAQRLCMDSASKWVKPSSERGKEAANYISLKWQPWGGSGLYGNVEEEEAQMEGGSLKEAHL